MAGVVRAADRVAFWHEAAEPNGINSDEVLQQKYVKSPSTSEPPAGVVIPNSNKYKGPVTKLKSVLDSISDDDQTPPNSHPAIASFLTGPTNAAFAGTYFKPGYQAALKSSLGEANYAKLLKHAPPAHVTALTTHVQKPAPKSNKFIQPANQLKKLLENPNTQTEHVTSWLEGHPQFQGTYLTPEYDTALKGHLGDKAYQELQKHLKAADKSPATPVPTTAVDPQKAQDQAAQGGAVVNPVDQVKKSLEKNFPGFHEVTQDQALAPEGYAQAEQKAAPNWTELGTWVGPKGANSAEFDALKGKALHPDSSYSDQVKQTVESDPAFHEWFHSHTKADQASLSGLPGATYTKFLKWKAKHPNAGQEAVPTPEAQDQEDIKAIQQEMAPPEEPKQSTLGEQLEALNKVHGTSFGGANWDKYLKTNPEDAKKQLAKHIKSSYSPELFKALQQIYDQHFGEKSPQEEQPTPAAQEWPEGYGLGDMAKIINPALSGSNVQKLNDGDPDTLKSFQDLLQGGAYGDKTDALQKMLADYYAKQQPAGAPEEGGTQASPGSGQQHPALLADIKKVFPNAHGDLDGMDDAQLKQQLENMLKYLPEHPGYKNHPGISGIQKVYDKWFGGKGTPTEVSTPEAASAKNYPSYEEMQGVFPAITPEIYAQGYDLGDPDKVKAAMEKALKGAFSGGAASKNKLKALYDKYFGGQSSPSVDDIASIDDPEPADLGYGDEAYTSADEPQAQGKPTVQQVIDDLVNHPSGDWSSGAGGFKSLNENNLEEKLKGWSEGMGVGLGSGAQKAAKEAYDKYFGSGAQAQPSAGSSIDLKTLAQEYGKIHGIPPGDDQFNDVAKAKTPEEAKAALAANLQDWQEAADAPDGDWAKPQATSLKALYDKYFGGTTQPKSVPIPDAMTLAKEVGAVQGIGPGINNGGKKFSQMTPEEAKAALEDWSTNDAIPDDAKAGYKAILDKYFGGGGASSPKPVDVNSIVNDLKDLTGWNEVVDKIEGGSPEHAQQALKQHIDMLKADGSYYAGELQDLYDKYFGGSQVQADPKYPTVSWMKQHWPKLSGDFYTPEGIKKWIDQGGDESTVGKQWIADQYGDKDAHLQAQGNPLGDLTGGPPVEGSFDPEAQPTTYEQAKKMVDAVFPNMSTFGKESYAHQFMEQSPQDWKDNLDWLKSKDGWSTYAAGGSVAPPPVAPPWDPQGFATEYNAIVPGSGSSVATGSATAEKAMQKVQQLINDYPGTEQTKKLQGLYDKWFIGTPGGGTGTPAGMGKKWDASMPLGDAVKKAFPGLVGGNVKSFNEDPASKQGVLKQVIDNDMWTGQGADNQQLKEIYDTYFGDTYGTGGGTPVGDLPVQPFHHQEAEEDEGVSAPFKDQEPTPEDVSKWTSAKPVDGGSWKDFANWWGATKLTPEQEQQIYSTWFPGKNPAKASDWFQKVFSFYSKPSTGDLGATGVPSWAHNDWAFGKNAADEWPVFKEWASKSPGLAKNMTIKQKLQVWQSLSKGDKAILKDNYLPSNPVDQNALVAAMQKAYPDSDFSKWATLPQGNLKNSLQMLTKAGYAKAVPIYNQFYGENAPLPENAVDADEPAEVQPKKKAPKSIPINKMPTWAKSNNYGFGGNDAGAQKYTAFKTFANVMGLGDDVLDGQGDTTYLGYSNPIQKMIGLWQTIPTYFQKQLEDLKPEQYPFHSPDQLDQWLQQQPKIKDDVQSVLPDWQPSGYYHPWDKATVGSTADKQKYQLIQLMNDADPSTYQKLLGVYHKWFENAHPTLGQALTKADPNANWDQFLKTHSKDDVKKQLKTLLKKETDPEKWVQYVDAWYKYFDDPNTGVGGIKKQMGKPNAGYPAGADSLKYLKYWKEHGAPTDQNPFNMYYNNTKYGNDQDWNPGPYITNYDSSTLGKHPQYMGWTDPNVSVGHYKADPALLGDFSSESYTAPEQTKGNAQYQAMLEKFTKNKAQFSVNDEKTVKSEEFQNWFASTPKAYKDVFQHNPGIAIDDFKNFMTGGDVPATPEGGKKQVFDVSPFANIPKGETSKIDLKKKYGPAFKIDPHDEYQEILHYKDYDPFAYNTQRDPKLKFPRAVDQQETIPLPAGQQWAPQYKGMPIYRVVRVNLRDHDDDPEREVLRKQIHDIITEQKPKDKPAQPTLFDDEKGQEWPKDAPPIPKTPDQWMGVLEWAKKNGVTGEQMYDLAEKAGATPGKFGQPPLANQPANWEDPRLADLLLKYIELYKKSKGGLGIHWTRSRAKGYAGVPSAGHGATVDDPQLHDLPILMTALWGGQGEDPQGRDSAFDPNHPGELEHSLLSKAPLLMRRLQIRSPDNDWHDTMDYGPMSLWPPGRDEQTKDKPSLKAEIKDKLGVNVPTDWDDLVPGYEADQKFNQLVKEHPEAQKQIEKIYQHYFVGRPDLTTKPHHRQASLQRDVRTFEADIQLTADIFDEDAFPKGYKTPMFTKKTRPNLPGGDPNDDPDDEFLHRKYFSPHEVNPKSDSPARPRIKFGPEDLGNQLTFDGMPKGHAAAPVYRGMRIFDPKIIEQIQSGHPDAANNLLNSLGQGSYSLGSHWSTDPEQSMEWATTPVNQPDLKQWASGHGTGLPVMLSGGWMGQGEDPYRTDTRGDYADEKEMTMLPGTPLSINRIQYQHPSGDWRDVQMDSPQDRTAAIEDVIGILEEMSWA